MRFTETDSDLEPPDFGGHMTTTLLGYLFLHTWVLLKGFDVTSATSSALVNMLPDPVHK